MHEFISENHCEWCQIYATDQRYRALLDAGVGAFTFPDPIPVCRFLGEEHRTTAIVEVGLDPRKRYRHCAKGKGKVSGFVCGCEGCNSKCDGFVAAEVEVN